MDRSQASALMAEIIGHIHLMDNADLRGDDDEAKRLSLLVRNGIATAVLRMTTMHFPSDADCGDAFMGALDVDQKEYGAFVRGWEACDRAYRSINADRATESSKQNQLDAGLASPMSPSYVFERKE